MNFMNKWGSSNSTGSVETVQTHTGKKFEHHRLDCHRLAAGCCIMRGGLESRSVKDLKALLQERGVDISNVIEKDDLIRLAQLNEQHGGGAARPEAAQGEAHASREKSRAASAGYQRLVQAAATLGVEVDAPEDDVKSAYHQLARRWHPDKNQDAREDAEVKFKEVQAAHALLSSLPSGKRAEARRAAESRDRKKQRRASKEAGAASDERRSAERPAPAEPMAAERASNGRGAGLPAEAEAEAGWAWQPPRGAGEAKPGGASASVPTATPAAHAGVRTGRSGARSGRQAPADRGVCFQDVLAAAAREKTEKSRRAPGESGTRVAAGRAGVDSPAPQTIERDEGASGETGEADPVRTATHSSPHPICSHHPRTHPAPRPHLPPAARPS